MGHPVLTVQGHNLTVVGSLKICTWLNKSLKCRIRKEVILSTIKAARLYGTDNKHITDIKSANSMLLIDQFRSGHTAPQLEITTPH